MKRRGRKIAVVFGANHCGNLGRKIEGEVRMECERIEWVDAFQVSSTGREAVDKETKSLGAKDRGTK